MRCATKLFVVVLAVLGLVLSTTRGPVVHAQSAGQALSISPPVLELAGDPGQVVTATIKITNISSGDLLIKNQINDFGPKNETGEPNIIFDDTQSTSYSLRNWVQGTDPFVLGSKQTREVKFTINIPANSEPGGHYAVFRFTGQAPEIQDTGVAISASIGSLVLLRVSGEVKESASLADFYSVDSNLVKSNFFEYGPIGFLERITNNSNVHIKPTGTIEIVDIFGRKVSEARVNGDPSNTKDLPKSILPNSTRKFDQNFGPKWMLGYYTAKLNLTYGTTNQKLTGSFGFWVIPYKAILISLLAIITVVLIVRFMMKGYKKRILKQAQVSTAKETEGTSVKPSAKKVPAKAGAKTPSKPSNRKK